jgi:hypothetical protein
MDTIGIVSVVDVVSALAAGTVAGSFYMVDNNKTKGSTDEGTEILKTRVRKGDQVVWISIPLECEAFVSITGIEIDKKFREYCDLKKGVYPDTNVVYWLGDIKKELDVAIPYNLKFRLGSHEGDMATTSSPSLIGETPVPAVTAAATAKTE